MTVSFFGESFLCAYYMFFMGIKPYNKHVITLFFSPQDNYSIFHTNFTVFLVSEHHMTSLPQLKMALEL